MNKSIDVDAYIQAFPKDVQTALQAVRQAVRAAAPREAEESIAYGVVGYKLAGKPLVYFGGYAKHIGFYATPNGTSAFKDKLAKYKQGKGSVQFPLDQPMPLDLITDIVRYRAAEVLR